MCNVDHSTSEQTCKGISISQSDLDRELTQAQIDWLLSNLNAKAFIKALSSIGPQAEHIATQQRETESAT